MITKTNRITSASSSRWLTKLVALMCVIAVIMTATQVPIYAQEAQYERPSWKFGLSGGLNLNYYQGTTQNLSPTLFSPAAFGHGNGMGLFLAPMVEYHKPNSVFGFMLQVGYDSRRGTFDQVMTACGCPADLSTELSYLTIEPSLRVAPFRSNLFLFAGPRLAFGLNESFEYKKGVHPDFPNSTQAVNVSDDFGDMEKTQFSMKVGIGLDIPVSPQSSRTQFIVTPSVSFHPYFGQSPRSIETWNITTIRAGLALKFGRGKQIEFATPTPPAPLPSVNFTVDSPVNDPVTISFIETFPLRNYIFFEEGQTTIPDRYITLNNEQAANFNENQLGRFNQISATGRSARQMTVYYNILNIVGYRMVTNPSTSITLVGSSHNTVREANQRAESVKSYLVSTYGISESRISTNGSIVTQQTGDRPERELLRQEDSRVAIESNSAALLKEFQTGPDAPIGSDVAEVAPVDSYVTFNVDGGTRAFKSWKLEAKDDAGEIKIFGPYTQNNVSLSGQSILDTRSRGRYTFTMIGETHNGRIVREEKQANVVLWVNPVVEHGTRYSVIYKFDNSQATAAYEKFLLEVVTPTIPEGARINIQGYSDTIGDMDYNQRLSEARAADVEAIIKRGLASAGRTDVTFDVKGHGQIISQAQFSNSLPEERYYNRMVLIDIVTQQ